MNIDEAIKIVMLLAKSNISEDKIMEIGKTLLAKEKPTMNRQPGTAQFVDNYGDRLYAYVFDKGGIDTRVCVEVRDSSDQSSENIQFSTRLQWLDFSAAVEILFDNM